MIDLIIICVCIGLCMLAGHEAGSAHPALRIARAELRRIRREGNGIGLLRAEREVWWAGWRWRGSLVATALAMSLWPMWCAWRGL